jgi:gliding motility-associated-like protein
VTNEDEITNDKDPFDTDSDGLDDFEEFTGADNPLTPKVPTGTNDGADPCDPNPTVFPELCDNSTTIPNIFTPNGDGVNDLFHVDGVINARIVNRWGQLINEWNSPLGSWDGFMNAGVVAPPGTFLLYHYSRF